MSEPFIGEIKLLGFGWAPRGWALCDGAALPVQQNAALYSLLGIQFGGDGRQTFKLPDLRGRTPVGIGGANRYVTGAAFGEERVVLKADQLPRHIHTVYGSNAPSDKFQAAGANDVFGTTLQPLFGTGVSGKTPMSAGCVSPTGPGGGHNNMQPSLVMNFCIALMGLYPQRD
jgi:microcystin-dependent protein